MMEEEEQGEECEESFWSVLSQTVVMMTQPVYRCGLNNVSFHLLDAATERPPENRVEFTNIGYL